MLKTKKDFYALGAIIGKSNQIYINGVIALIWEVQQLVVDLALGKVELLAITTKYGNCYLATN